MTYVKICGITTKEMLEAARDADAVGFVVDSPDSHRNLTLEDAAELARRTGPFHASVAVTAERDINELIKIVEQVRPQALQVPFRAGQNAFSVLRRIYPTLQIIVACRPEDAHLVPDEADALVLDAATKDGYGGTGELTDWNRARTVREMTDLPVILAGGLTPENVADSVAAVSPYGVDVSSGVETDLEKDPSKIAAFIANAKKVPRG